MENHGSERLYFVDITLENIYIKDAEKEIKELGSEVTIILKKKNIYAFNQEGKRIYDENEVNKVYDEFRTLERKS
jgi:sn-glycerol 3-phosphate transport system ATP-binding protein